MLRHDVWPPLGTYTQAAMEHSIELRLELDSRQRGSAFKIEVPARAGDPTTNNKELAYKGSKGHTKDSARDF